MHRLEQENYNMYELPLQVTIDGVPAQSVTLMMETFDTVLLRSEEYIYVLTETKHWRETGPLAALHNMFVCGTEQAEENDKFSWFRLEGLTTIQKPGWRRLPAVQEPTMAVVKAAVMWGWRGLKGDHSNVDEFTFVRVKR